METLYLGQIVIWDGKPCMVVDIIPDAVHLNVFTPEGLHVFHNVPIHELLPVGLVSVVVSGSVESEPELTPTMEINVTGDNGTPAIEEAPKPAPVKRVPRK